MASNESRKCNLEYCLMICYNFSSFLKDLNPIEHLWKLLKDAVDKRQPTSVEMAWEICQEEWGKLGPECKKLIDTYNNRLEAVIAAKGEATKY